MQEIRLSETKIGSKTQQKVKCYDNPNGNQPDKSTNLADNNVHFICNGLVTTLRCNDYMLGTKNALCREDTQKCDAFTKGAPGNELDL